MGLFVYSIADFLYGPIWAVSLITAVFALGERICERAPRRMLVALLAAFLAARMMVLGACIRSANREYHIIHPELHLESSIDVSLVPTTLVAGVTGAGWHFLGWALVLIGSAGWTNGSLPRGLCGFYLVGGAAGLFVYQFPDLEGAAALLMVAWALWQGFLLWRDGKGPTQIPVKIEDQSG